MLPWSDLAEIEAAIGAAMRPFAAQQVHLTTIPGVDELTAASIIAEIGVDMSAFRDRPTPRGLGWRLPGQPRERGQAEAARHPQTQYIP